MTGDSATMRERREGVESNGAYVDIEFHSAVFAWFRTALPLSYGITWDKMALHDAIGVNCLCLCDLT